MPEAEPPLDVFVFGVGVVAGPALELEPPTEGSPALELEPPVDGTDVPADDELPPVDGVPALELDPPVEGNDAPADEEPSPADGTPALELTAPTVTNGVTTSGADVGAGVGAGDVDGSASAMTIPGTNAIPTMTAKETIVLLILFIFSNSKLIIYCVQ